MNIQIEYVCSNCGAPCGQDSRMGSLDVYLICECSSPKNTTWYNDGRGGYDVCLNNARPILKEDYKPHSIATELINYLITFIKR